LRVLPWLARATVKSVWKLSDDREWERFKGRNPMKGRPAEPDRQAEIDFAKGVAGSLQNKADAIEKQFGTKHDKSTISKWLKGFDQEAV